MKCMLVLLSFLSATSFASEQACSEFEIEKKVFDSALYIETLNGGGRPLMQEMYSLSSEQGAYVVILSYSGVQNIWKVKTDPTGCHILSVSKS
jgi:hypothetical protein